MYEIITNLYDYFITFASLSLLLVALFYWIVLSIDRKQQKDFDTKYRETETTTKGSNMEWVFVASIAYIIVVFGYCIVRMINN